MILYDYIKSSASFRVRIALNLKAIHHELCPIVLTEHEQSKPTYLALNPQGLVPSLQENGLLISQSLAIIEYLEERYPSPSLLPKPHFDRAQVRSLGFYIACDMHPLNNLRVRELLKTQFNASDKAVREWCHHWLSTGFEHLEHQLQQTSTGQFCFGNQVTLADVCLIPQVYSALRFEFSLNAYPLIKSIHAHCMTLKAFQMASPDA
jgi:maleylacetoacetate isomerase